MTKLTIEKDEEKIKELANNLSLELKPIQDEVNKLNSKFNELSKQAKSILKKFFDQMENPSDVYHEFGIDTVEMNGKWLGFTYWDDELRWVSSSDMC